MASEVIQYEDVKFHAEMSVIAFDQGFGRYDRFRGGPDRYRDFVGSGGSESITLKEAETVLRELEDLRTKHLGKKSGWAVVKKMIGRIPSEEERASAGQLVLAHEIGMKDKLADAERTLKLIIDYLRVERERVDVTLPGRRPRRGHLHPITLLRQRIEDIFVSMGYAVEDGPEVETDFYNFTALNIPELHPARSPQDTFYTTDGLSLRSQTSTVQIHAMQRRRPPLRVVAPGRVFRRDTPDATHNPMFPAGEAELAPFVTELDLPNGESFLVVVNNSLLPFDGANPLGVLHKAVIPSPDPAGRRVINSIGFTPPAPGVGLPPAELERFLTRDDLD